MAKVKYKGNLREVFLTTEHFICSWRTLQISIRGMFCLHSHQKLYYGVRKQNPTTHDVKVIDAPTFFLGTYCIIL